MAAGLIRLVFAAMVAIAACILNVAAHADAPPPPPRDRVVCSPSGIFCAHMVVDANRTTIKRDGQVLWSMPGWFRVASLADDGMHFITGYDGASLLQPDYRPDTVMVTFWKRDSVIRRVLLSDIIEDPARLRRTVSHSLWGHSVGLDPAGRFVIHTIENRRIAFDVETGAAVQRRREPYPGNGSESAGTGAKP